MSLAHQIMPAAEVRDLDLDPAVIRLDQAAQPREALNNDRIAEYAEAMKAEDHFPPLAVFFDGSTYWLADGFHRHYAAQHAGRKLVRCSVRQGGLREAILYSVGANAKHGLSRSDADKERAIKRLLADGEWCQWSDREIARRCRVDHKTVARVRKSVSGEAPQIERKVERGGTVFTQKVAKAKSAVRAENAPTEPARSEPLKTKNSEPEPHETPASEFDTQPSAEVDAADIQLAWNRAGDEGRALFLTRNSLRQESNSQVVGGVDVDRSAERASSAVEVGATNSPDGANETGRFESGSLTEILVKPQVQVLPGDASRVAKGGPTGMGRSDGGERPAPNSNSSATVQTQQADSPALSQASGSQFINPQCQRPATCKWVHSQASCSECASAAAKARVPA